ncbi:MAG: hypothetical protein R3Y43_01755 [Alphaproteobacteria bacterium]
MLQLKAIAITCLISFNAYAGLYGLDSANPLTKEELNQTSLFRKTSILNYPQEMRNNIITLSQYGKKNNPDFQIVIHEGQELAKTSTFEKGVSGFEKAIKKEYDQNFLAKEDNMPNFEKEYLSYIDGVVKNKIYFKDKKLKFLKNSNHKLISKFSDIENYWFDLSDDDYKDKSEKIKKIINSNFDIIIINPMFKNKEKYTEDEINSMKFKKSGAPRLILAQMNLSEISPKDYRYKQEWNKQKPKWFARISLVNEKDYITKYWTSEWKKLLSRHFKAIVESGYNGAFLTGADNHKYFEKTNPIY